MGLGVIRKAAVCGLCASALLLTAASLSHAQSTGEEEEGASEPAQAPGLRLPPSMTIDDEGVTEPQPRRRRVRVEDPYAAQGLDAGAFRLFPQLEFTTEVTSNAQSSAGGKADVSAALKPSFRLESDWVRHQLTINGEAEVQRFADDKTLASESGFLGAKLRLDIRRSTRADLDLQYELDSTGGGTSDVPATATGRRRDHALSASTAVSHDLGGVEARLRLGASHNWFDDVSLSGGGSEGNSDRAYTEVSASIRGSVTRDAAVRPFAEAAYEPRIYNRSVDRNGNKRNSHGLRLTAGVALSDDPIWSGEIGASLLYRAYEDSGLKDQLAPGLSASLTWQPTDLTRFEFNTGVSLEETISAGESAKKRWTASAAMTHALRENVDLKSGAGLTLDKDSDTTLTIDANLGIEWKLNPYLSLAAGYAGTWVESDVAGADYGEHRLLSSIILKR